MAKFIKGAVIKPGSILNNEEGSSVPLTILINALPKCCLDKAASHLSIQAKDFVPLTEIGGSYSAIFLIEDSIIAVLRTMMAPALSPKIFCAFVLLIIACMSSLSVDKP